MAASALSRLWSSPTAMTLASTGLQSATSLLVLPLVLYRFDAPTVALWALFSSIAAVINIASQSFTVTYVRAVAFCAAGARDLGEITAGRKASEAREPNAALLAEVVSGARVAYAALALAAAIVLAGVGTALVDHLVAATPDPEAGWLAWALVVATTALSTYGNVYIGFLEGHERVALVRRWDAVFALFVAVSSVVVLIADAGLLALVASTQGWAIVRVIRNRLLCRGLGFRTLPQREARPALRALWPAAWRSFLGVASIFGVNYAGAIFYAQIGAPTAVATYLLAIRLIDTLSAVARAPFYSRIPELVRRHAQGQTAAQVASARSGMRASYWLFTAGLLAATLVGPRVFTAIGSSVPFPPLVLWLALGSAHLLERYGAMHLQLYSTTNQIIWHTAAAGYSIIYIVALVVLHRPLGVYAFPVAMALGYAGWYSWYCARRSYQAFGLTFWSFERTLFLPPFALAVATMLVAWIAS